MTQQLQAARNPLQTISQDNILEVLQSNQFPKHETDTSFDKFNKDLVKDADDLKIKFVSTYLVINI